MSLVAVSSNFVHTSNAFAAVNPPPQQLVSLHGPWRYTVRAGFCRGSSLVVSGAPNGPRRNMHTVGYHIPQCQKISPARLCRLDVSSSNHHRLVLFSTFDLQYIITVEMFKYPCQSQRSYYKVHFWNTRTFCSAKGRLKTKTNWTIPQHRKFTGIFLTHFGMFCLLLQVQITQGQCLAYSFSTQSRLILNISTSKRKLSNTGVFLYCRQEDGYFLFYFHMFIVKPV